MGFKKKRVFKIQFTKKKFSWKSRACHSLNWHFVFFWPSASTTWAVFNSSSNQIENVGEISLNDFHKKKMKYLNKAFYIYLKGFCVYIV